MKTIDEKFQAFHEKHPEVYVKFKDFANELLFRGHRRLSGSLIMERVRWEAITGKFRSGTFELEQFKINNNFTALYVRKLEGESVEFAGMFETRKRKEELLSENPVFSVGQAVVAVYIGPYKNLSTGKKYNVVEYHAASTASLAFVVIHDDFGKRTACHANRFKASKTAAGGKYES